MSKIIQGQMRCWLSAGFGMELLLSCTSSVDVKKEDSFNEMKIDWPREFQRLWDEHVPSSGQALTVQGELIRIAGKLTDQAYRNGNMNWDEDHETMWRSLGTTLDDSTVFTSDIRKRIRIAVDEIIKNHADPDTSDHGSSYYFLSEMEVRWCLAHPRPIDRKSDSRYKR